MKLAVILVVILVKLFDFFLKFLNYKNRNAKIPESVGDIYNAETYAKRNAYEMERLSLSIISGLVALAATLGYLVFDFHSVLFDYISQYTTSIYLQSYFMLGVVMGISFVLSVPFSLYETFKIEAKYGFNRTSFMTFIGDKIKQVLIFVIIFGGLLSLFLLLYSLLGEYVSMAFFFVLVAVSLISSVLFRHISKLFYKFSPLEEGELKTKISEYANKVGFSVKNIFVMNASKRSTKTNAYFTGFGRTKSIVLFDTLLERFTHDEIVSILGHEVGHSKHKHVLINFLLNLITIAITVVAAHFIVSNISVSMAFGFTSLNVAFGLHVFIMLYSSLMLLIYIPGNALSRKFEYQADRYAGETAGVAPMISALKKLAGSNYANLVPHPFVVKMTYSHPPIDKRVVRLMELNK